MNRVKTMLAGAAWLAAVVAPLASQAPPPPRVVVPRAGVTVPMRTFGGRPVIGVTIRGRTVDFVVDTGAAVGALDTDVAAMMGLAIDGGRIVVGDMAIGAVRLTGVTLRATTFMRGLGENA